MVQAFALLLTCQLVGEGVVRALAWPIPGPVVGLLLLAVGLLLWQRRGARDPGGDLQQTLPAQPPLAAVAGGLLSHLSLLFVPAGVGIVQQGGVLLRNGPALLVALLASTVLTLMVTALVFVAVLRVMRRSEP